MQEICTSPCSPAISFDNATFNGVDQMLYKPSDEESDKEIKCELSDDKSVVLSKSPAIGKR